MKRIAGAIALYLVIGVALAAESAPQTPEELPATLCMLARERILQFDRGDREVWSRHVADGYVIATPFGPVRTKAEVMDGFGPPPKGYRDVFGFEDVHVRRDGDTAVLSYVIDEHEFWDEQKYVIPKLRKTDTYVLRAGRWLVLASQETFIPAEYKVASIDPAVFPKYVGRYQLMRSLSYEVSVEDTHLLLREDGKPEAKVLLPISADTFFAKGASAQYIFVRGEHGQVTHFLIRDNGYDITVRKTL